MKLIQYRGPFAAGQTITVPAQQNYQYVYIGIQIPKRMPIALIDTIALPVDLEINGTLYKINECDILEFDDLNEISWNIEFQDDLPWESIIDIMYDTQDV